MHILSISYINDSFFCVIVILLVCLLGYCLWYHMEKKKEKKHNSIIVISLILGFILAFSSQIGINQIKKIQKSKMSKKLENHINLEHTIKYTK